MENTTRRMYYASVKGSIQELLSALEAITGHRQTEMPDGSDWLEFVMNEGLREYRRNLKSGDKLANKRRRITRRKSF